MTEEQKTEQESQEDERTDEESEEERTEAESGDDSGDSDEDKTEAEAESDEAKQEIKKLEEEGPPEKLEDWPTGKAKYETFGGPEGEHSYAEGPEEKMGPADVRHREDGSVEVAGEEADDPKEYKGEPIPGGPTDPDTPNLRMDRASPEDVSDVAQEAMEEDDKSDDEEGEGSSEEEGDESSDSEEAASREE